MTLHKHNIEYFHVNLSYYENSYFLQTSPSTVKRLSRDLSRISDICSNHVCHPNRKWRRVRQKDGVQVRVPTLRRSER